MAEPRPWSLLDAVQTPARQNAALEHTEHRPWPSIGDVLDADPRSLAHFLTERYCLYTSDEGRLRRIQIHHEPWPLQPAEAAIEENTMTPRGVKLVDEELLLHFSARQGAVFWPFEDA